MMNALLFSLPGTPVIYYGDEIGMGDNIFLGDRNGVRTPMQWSSDRNAGFSRANPQRLYLPVNIDPEYHYETINVEAQQNNSHSLLWFTKRLIQQRKRFGLSDAARWSFSIPAIARCWRSSANFRTRGCWWSPTCRALRSVRARPRSVKAWCRWKSSAAPSFPPSPRVPICCRLARMRSTGSICSRAR